MEGYSFVKVKEWKYWSLNVYIVNNLGFTWNWIGVSLLN